MRIGLRLAICLLMPLRDMPSSGTSFELGFSRIISTIFSPLFSPLSLPFPGELNAGETVSKMETVQQKGGREVKRQVMMYSEEESLLHKHAMAR